MGILGKGEVDWRYYIGDACGFSGRSKGRLYVQVGEVVEVLYNE